MIFVSMTIIYEYKGWLFEYNRNKAVSPWPLKKDLNPKQQAGRAFYKMFKEFSELTPKEQDKFRVDDK